MARSCPVPQALLEALRTPEAAQQALLPLLWALVDVLQPHARQAQPSLGAKEAVHRWVAGLCMT